MLNELTSFFELFCTFNFAFAISDEFIAILKNKIIQGYNPVLRELLRIKIAIGVSKDTFYEKSQNENLKTKNKDDLMQIQITLKNIETEFESHNIKTVGNIDTVEISEGFKYICLIGGLHCIFMILIVGFSNSLEMFSDLLGRDSVNCLLAFEECFFGYNFILLIYLILIFNRYKFFNGHGHVKCMFTLFKLSTICVFIFTLDCFQTQIHFPKWSYQLGIILSLINPSFHFATYFIKALEISKRQSSAYLIELSQFDIRLNNLISQIENLKPEEKIQRGKKQS
jgi:hypothetical protein